MLYLYTGTPGSGKSLHLARVILNNVRLGSPVICNFNLNLPENTRHKDNLYIKYNSELSVEFLIDFARNYFNDNKFREGQILLVIDEAQIPFNSRSWNQIGRDKWIQFFSNHRHLGYDIILCCQFDLMIDKQVRSLVEYEVIHRKVSNYGIRGYILMLFFLSPCLFCAVKVWYPMKERVSSEFYRFHKKYSYIYDSYSSTFVESDIDL